MTGVPVQVATEWSQALVRAADQVTAVATVGVGQVEATASGLIDGRHASARRWIETAAHTSGGEASAIVARARDVTGDYARVGEAWLAGDVSGAAVRELSVGLRQALRVVPGLRREAERTRALDLLLPFATRHSVADVHRLVRGLRFVLDPDGATQAAMDAYDDQTLRVSSSGEMAQISVWTTKEVAAAFLTVLDRQVDTWFHAGALPGDEPRHPLGHRGDVSTGTAIDPIAALTPTRGRRDHLLALAFGETFTGLLDRGLVGTHHGVAPHITLTVDVDRCQAGLGGELLVPGTDDPALLTSATVARLLCDAEVTPVITASASGGCCTGTDGILGRLHDAARTVLYVGREVRTTPVRLRRALEVRDGHCAFPDCRVDVSRTHAHHVAEWLRDNGSTDIDNLVLLCSRHHHAVHEGGWSVAATPGLDPGSTGHWRFTAPDRPRRL
jgi:hypothetical protein